MLEQVSSQNHKANLIKVYLSVSETNSKNSNSKIEKTNAKLITFKNR